MYFGPNDYLFGPVYSNDSLFVSGNGSVSGSPSFGDATVNPKVPSAVMTADPNCLFVDDANGMSGSDSNCASADNEVALYDTVNSADDHAVETPPRATPSSASSPARTGACTRDRPRSPSAPSPDR